MSPATSRAPDAADAEGPECSHDGRAGQPKHGMTEQLLTPAQLDEAFAALVVTLPDDAAEAEISPVTDLASYCLAEVIAGLIEANPELNDYVSAQLGAASPVNGVRIVPVAALGWALRMTMEHRPDSWHRPVQ